jgi:fructose-bisphosphate aldolase, class I
VTATGVALRLGRLFRPDGRSSVVAFDHGTIHGVPPGGEDVRQVLTESLRGGPDAVLVGPGTLARHADLFAHRGAPAVLLRTDLLFTGGHPHSGEHHRPLLDVPAAHRLGADALVVFLNLGWADGAGYADNLAAVGRVAARAHDAGLPVICEVVAWGAMSHHDPAADLDLLAYGCRAAAEAGVDAIKTTYPGDPAGMRRITATTGVPVLVLGGVPGSFDALLADTADALAGGAAGTIYGRALWHTDGIADRVRRVTELVHTAA